MKRSLQLMIAIAMMAVLVASNAFAYDIINVTLKDPDDNFLHGRDTYQDVNRGDLEFLKTQSWESGDTRPILKFDEVSDIFTSGTFVQLDSASLRLYGYESLNITDDRTYTVYGVVSSWTELGSTWLTTDGATSWTTAGGDYTAVGSATATVTGDEGWIEWDVTSIMQGWIDEYMNNGLVSDFGFLIMDDSEGATSKTYTKFYSKNSTYNETSGPELVMQYQAVPEASTIGLFGLGLIGGFVSYWRKTSKILKLNYNKEA